MSLGNPNSISFSYFSISFEIAMLKQMHEWLFVAAVNPLFQLALWHNSILLVYKYEFSTQARHQCFDWYQRTTCSKSSTHRSTEGRDRYDSGVSKMAYSWTMAMRNAQYESVRVVAPGILGLLGLKIYTTARRRWRKRKGRGITTNTPCHCCAHEVGPLGKATLLWTREPNVSLMRLIFFIVDII